MLRSVLINLTRSSVNRSCGVLIARNYAPRYKREPGIQNRLNTDKDFGRDFIENIDDPEHVDALEADFMNAHHAHYDYEKETRQLKDFNYTMSIGRKYFKTRSPNFLTWAEKEQIRKLNDEDPEKYSPDELSNSFPADPKTISILIRNRWQPKDTIKVQKHDEKVKQNWEAFKEGKLEIEQFLAEHLKKFAFRDLNKLAKPEPYRKLGTQVPKPKGNEFLSIITSCKKYKEVDEVGEEVHQTVTSGRPLRVRKIESEETRMPELSYRKDQDSFKLRGRYEFSNTPMTLDELQEVAPQYRLPDEEKKDEVVFGGNIPKFKEVKPLQEKPSAVTEFKKKIDVAMDVKPFIRIPKKVWKRGQVYKLRDCFYSDDGEFLYRVPGLA